MKNISLSAVLIGIVLISSAASAQTFQTLAPGSKYLCGYMPDGTNLIFTDQGSDRVLVDPKKAVKKVKADIQANRNRIERLKEIKASLKDGQLDVGELRALKKAYLNGNFDDPLPKGKKERREAIDQLIADLRTINKVKQNEITAIRDCADGKRPDSGTIGLSYEVIKFKAADGVYIALIMRTPAVYNGNAASQRWYCIRDGAQPSGSAGAPRRFLNNPCFYGTPAFAGNNCSAFAGAGNLADFYAFRVFKPAAFWELDDPQVLLAEDEFREQWAAGVAGRIRGVDGANGTSQTTNDSCDSVP